MSLNRNQVTDNYRQCINMAVNLMRRSILQRSGKKIEVDENNEVVLSAVSEPAVIGLISSVLFDADLYRPIITFSLDKAGKELFPDIHKKRFMNIDKIENQIQEYPCTEIDSFPKNISIHDIRALLSKENDVYLMTVLLKKYPKWRRKILNRFSQYSSLPEKELAEHINEQLQKMRLCFPDGQINDTYHLNGNDELCDNQVTACYKNIYCGVERSYPVNFLKRDSRQRAAIITRFLIENILGQDPALLLKDLEEVFFIRFKLQNVYRLFNYSANRAFHNAYPELIPPWLNSRTDSGSRVI